MLSEHNRAFKEWAVVCEAMKDGRQIILIRKGGIREEEGIFQVNDPEFFLLPTYEHQDPDLLQPAHLARLQALQAQDVDPRAIRIGSYAVVDTVRAVDEGTGAGDGEARIHALSEEYIWNERYVRSRFDFNPYDPLYLIILRVYNLPQTFTLPMRPDYGGCKSWVTLAEKLPTQGSVPALPEEEYLRRRERILRTLA